MSTSHERKEPAVAANERDALRAKLEEIEEQSKRRREPRPLAFRTLRAGAGVTRRIFEMSSAEYSDFEQEAKVGRHSRVIFLAGRPR
jgi:hypothetical protein